MHWFWRATIAAVVTTGFSLWFHREVKSNWYVLGTFSTGIMHAGGEFYDATLPVSIGYVVYGLVEFLPVILLGIGLFGLLSRWWPRPNDATETRCRKCGYILRGITEPRCPECGERI